MYIEKKLRVIWICILINLVISIMILLNPFIYIITFPATIVHMCMLYQLRRASHHFRWAFVLRITTFLLSGLSILGSILWLFVGFLQMAEFWLSGFNSGGHSPSTIILFALFTANLILSLAADFHFYWALDERIDTHHYHYKPGLIRWCFYATLIGVATNILTSVRPNLLSVLLPIIPALIHLILLHPYIRAVWCTEQAAARFGAQHAPVAALSAEQAATPVTALSAALAVAKAHENKAPPKD